MAENTLKTVLKSYQKRLTNLTSRNKSLLLLSLSTEQFLDIHELDFLQNKPSFNLIEQLIAQKNTIPLCEIHDPRYERVNEVSKRLRKISRTEKFIEEERGSEDLYVGYPIIKGKFSDGTVVRCPLLFFPVTIVQKDSQIWQLQTREESITLNRSFLLAYSHFNQIKISDEFLENSFEDFSKDSLEFRTQLYEFLKDCPLKIDFNKELFVNELHHFEKMLKADLDLSENNGELKLYPQAVLGIFPQAGSFLVPDYEELLSAIGSQPSALDNEDLETLFPNTNNSEQFSTADSRQPIAKIKEENLLTPFAIDATQELALRQVKSGSSLVVQGPPGTGKSQLICNLVTDFTARGKKVLVVCQKRAALDVVQERLAQAGMRAFVGNVHDFKNDRKGLYEQILNQIEQIEEYQKQNNSLDAIFLDRNFTQESRQIDKISDTLQLFKDALFEVSECGLSVKELYLTSYPNQPFLDFKNEYKSFKFNEIDDFLKKFERYSKYVSLLVDGGDFWQERLTFENRQYSEIPTIIQTIESVVDFVQNLEKQSVETIGKLVNFQDLQSISSEKEVLQKLILTIENDKIYQVFARNIQEKIKLTTSKISQLEGEVAKFFAGQGIEITLPSTQLLPFLAKLNSAIDTKSNAIRGLFWGIFSKEKADIQNVTIANGLGLSLDDLLKLRQRIQNRIGLEKWWGENAYLFGKVVGGDTDHGISPPWSVSPPTTSHEPIWLRKGIRWFERHFQQLYQAEKVNKIWKSLVKKMPTIFENWQNLSWNEFQNKANFLIQKSQEITDNQPIWKNYLSEKQIELLATTVNVTTIKTYLKEHFDLMQEADALKASFSRIEWQIIERFLSQPSPVSPMVGVPTDHFLNSLKLAWIEHIEEINPILRSVSSLKISQLEEELQQAVLKKQELSQEILGLKLREETYRNLEKNRLQNVVTYRDLKHQVAKKRKLWSVRKLISEYSEEVFKLVPCWLASPETVSAIFPLRTNQEEPFFDLIIFDEASQCFAEQGIPALFRGKQVVIAGDSKQLQPNDLYRVRFETESDDLPELEIDSLLDLACQYLPQTQLKGHYRSQSLDLIDFSNRYFYKNTLSLLPDFQELNLQKPAIEYLKVDGVWENSTNPIEAEAVWNLVEKLNREYPEKSIGIVTFNAKQQGLIQDLIETKTIKFTHPIFIKNIENVQGDERDFIIFSVSYAPDAKGKMSMQFGSLNAQGGENRLNVAVTRAREKVFVISSILPNQLRVEDTLNEGPRLLKSYLEYALMVSEGKYIPTPHRSEKYQANWLLKEQLLNNNNQYIKELPFADLTVKDNQQYESLILTDDDLYYENLSPKETFAYIPAGLRAKGWKFERVFSRNFWKK
jgi:DNA polymerase IIIc chi subunit